VSVFDLIILTILAALTLRGIWKGMVSQIVSVTSFFICWIVATQFGSLVAPTIPLEAPWDQVAAMAVVFVITLIAIRFAHTALEKRIKDWHLEKLNKSFGGLLGFTKGLLLCLIITFFAVMISDTSRTVVFNSQSGSHLVQLITRISLFVPKDSYEFVHTQFDQFQSKVGEAVPGQTPETVQVQSSKTVQQMLAQLQQPKASSTSSLWTALTKWWAGSEKETTDTKTLVPASQTTQTATAQESLPATRYTPPTMPTLPADTFTNNTPQMATPNPPVVESFFVRQPGASVSTAEQSLGTSVSVPEVSHPQLPPLSPLPTLAPLSEPLPSLPESTPSLPVLPMPPHVGSDLLLRNSMQVTNPSASASVFRTP
jgi:membrane protein required for colicin V production